MVAVRKESEYADSSDHLNVTQPSQGFWGGDTIPHNFNPRRNMPSTLPEIERFTQVRNTSSHENTSVSTVAKSASVEARSHVRASHNKVEKLVRELLLQIFVIDDREQENGAYSRILRAADELSKVAEKVIIEIYGSEIKVCCADFCAILSAYRGKSIRELKEFIYRFFNLNLLRSPH